MGQRRLTKLDWTCDPLDVVAAWPADRPLMMLHSGRGHPRWGRRSIIGSPRKIVSFGDDPVADLDRLGEGGFIGYLGYELGRHFEPAAMASRPDDRGWPVAQFGWCPDALHFDSRDRSWYGPPRHFFDPAAGARDLGPFTTGVLRSSVTPDEYMAAVARTIEYISAGDIFQANLTRRLTTSFEGSTRRLCVEAMMLSGAWYGAYLELPDGRCLLSLSPELFLDAEAGTRRVVTRPIKGTRPAGVPDTELLGSAKDAAELHMIVDLMRNDLGRVCEFGSVRVPAARTIETHPTVHHGVGEVTGRLRTDVTLAGLLRATFPAGSVTGAPKIRAMQIIDELEPVTRGPYCGAVGFVGAGGRVELNVAIRTLVLTGVRPEGRWDQLIGRLDYGVGGGIVADSDPAAEYRETVDKAEILRQTCVRQTGRAAVSR